MKRTGLILSSLLCSSVLAFNLPSQAIKSYECSTCESLAKEPLEDRWTLSSQTSDTPITNRQRSYSYQEKISLKQLEQGYAITTKAPGAIVRIVPLDQGSSPELVLKAPKHPYLTLQDASTLHSIDGIFGEERLTSKYQHLFQIKPELGAGDFRVKTKDYQKQHAQHYLISVFDKFASSYLEVSTQNIHYQYGDKVRATVLINDDFEECSVHDIEAKLLGPKGQDMLLEVKKTGSNRFEAYGELTSEISDQGENWYVEIEANINVGSHKLKRKAHAAFSYTIPSATLLSIQKITSTPLSFRAEMDVATASRYALQSILYYKNTNGELTALETSQRSEWLVPGKQFLAFTFDNKQKFTEDMLYLGYFRLTDYGQMSTVYAFNQALKLSQLVE